MPRLRYLYEQKEYRVPLKDRMSIGRASDNDICVPLDSLSRHHAIVSRDAVTGAFTLSDNGSANGVMVKGQRINTAPLEPCSVFSLGAIEFTFLADDAAPQPAAAELSTSGAAAPAAAAAAPAAHPDRKSTRLNSSHSQQSRMPSSA